MQANLLLIIDKQLLLTMNLAKYLPLIVACQIRFHTQMQMREMHNDCVKERVCQIIH